MTTATVRTRLAQVAVKIESTIGTDAIADSPVAGDWVTARASVDVQQDQTPSTVLTGGLEDLPPIPGGRRVQVTVELQMYGAGTTAAPRWGRLLQACRMAEVLTETAVGAPTAATAGSGSTITLQTPFAATADLYRGMPVILAGNPSAGATDVCLEYTVGRVMTLARTYSPILSTSTTAQIPVNVLYTPISDEATLKHVTIYVYMDGLVHKAVGCSGTWSITLRAGAPAVLTCVMNGVLLAQNEAASLPTSYSPITRRPPIWVSGMSQLNRQLAQCQTATFAMNARTTYQDNPESATGFAPPIIVGAAPTITLDPMKHTTHSPTRATAYAAGTPIPFAALWGSTVGNRFALSCHSAQILRLNDGERGEMAADTITLQADQVNASFYLCAY